MYYFIVGVFCLALIASALVYGRILVDKGCLLTDAVVVFSDDNGSVVRLLKDEHLFYRINESLNCGSMVRVFDLSLVESACPKENWYFLFHYRSLIRLLWKQYRFGEAVFCYNDRGKQAIIQSKVSNNRWLAVDVKSKEPILLHYVPKDVAEETNPLVNYDDLLLTPSIGVSKTA